MGLNTCGLASKTLAYMSNKDLEAILNLKLDKVIEGAWIDLITNRLDDKLIIFRNESSLLIHSSFEYFEENYDYLEHLLTLETMVEKGVIFSYSETAMSTTLTWYDEPFKELVDEYDYYIDKIDIKGKNKLNIKNGDDIYQDILWKAILLYLSNFTSESHVEVMRFRKMSKEEENEATEEHNKEIQALKEKVYQLIEKYDSSNCFEHLRILKDTIKKLSYYNEAIFYGEESELFPTRESYDLKFEKDWVKSMIIFTCNDMSKKYKKIPSKELKYVATVWSRYDIFSDDELFKELTKNKWWKFWK